MITTGAFSKVFLTVLCVIISFGCISQGFKSITKLAVTPVVRHTAEKPQSKAWKYAGKWWAVYSKSDGTWVGRLDDAEWVNVLKISSSTSVEADCKMIDNLCHVFLWRKANSPSQLVSLEYDPATKGYVLWSARKATASINLDSGSETGTIDIDFTGRMWLATDGKNDIRVRWSDPPYNTWNGPHILASGITDDDICALVALPNQNQIGVLWSDQNAKRFGFKTHNNGADPTSWSADEVPASASALDIGKGMADDHLNFALAADGTLYCAVKTSYDTPGHPRLALLKRSPGGVWDPLYKVSENGTRGIVVLNEDAGKIKVIYTSQEEGGNILYRESSTSKISFGAEQKLIEGVLNNPTSTKDNYAHDILILASDGANLAGVLGQDAAPVTVALAPRDSVQSVTIFPNPVAGEKFYIQMKNKIDGEISVSISDATGKLIYRHSFQSPGSTLEIENLSLPAGFFLLSIAHCNGRETLRFVREK